MSTATEASPDFDVVGRAFAWSRRELQHELVVRGAQEARLTALHALIDSHPDVLTPDAHYTTALRQLVDDGAEHPEFPLLLSVHLFRYSRYFWERSINYVAVAALRSEWHSILDAHSLGADRWERLAARALLEQFAALSACMEVERCLNTGSPLALQRAARNAFECHSGVRTTAETIRARSGCPAGLVQLLDDVIDDTRRCVAYYSGVVEAATATESYLRCERAAADRLEAAIRRLEDIEDTELEDDRYGSELRAHRQTLEALLATVDDERLTVEDTKIVYVFPFTLLTPAPVRAFVDDLDACIYPDGIAGLAIQRRDIAELSETWHRSDGGGYSAHEIDFAPVVGKLEGGHEQVFTVQLRLGSFRNHYLRIETWLPRASLNDVYYMLRRGTGGAGAEEFCSEGRSWRLLADYASHVIEGFAATVGSELGPVELVSDGNRAMHAFVAPRVMRVVTPGGASRVVSSGELNGAPWLHAFTYPIHTLSHSLAEWVRGRSQHTFGAHEHGAIVRSRMSTLIALPGIPDFLFLEHEDRTEFVASLPPLFEAWRMQIEHRATEVRSLVDEMNAAFENAREDGDAVDVFARLEVEQKKLRTLDFDIRTALAALRSPSLCFSIEHRAALDAVMDAADVGRLEDDVTRMLGTLDHVFASTGDAAQRIEQRYLRRLEELEKERSRAMEILLDVIAVSSAFSIVDYLGGRTHMSNWVRVPVEVVTLVLVVAVLAAYHRQQSAFRWWKRADERHGRPLVKRGTDDEQPGEA